jgi:hypothetical protein
VGAALSTWLMKRPKELMAIFYSAASVRKAKEKDEEDKRTRCMRQHSPSAIMPLSRMAESLLFTAGIMSSARIPSNVGFSSKVYLDEGLGTGQNCRFRERQYAHS